MHRRWALPCLRESAATALDREFAQDPLMSAWEPQFRLGALSQGVAGGGMGTAILSAPRRWDLNLPEVKGAPAPSEVVLMGESPATGYRLLSDPGKLTLYRGATPVKKAAVAGKPVRIEVNAGRVRVLGTPGRREESRCACWRCRLEGASRGRVGVRFARWVSTETAVARAARVASPRLADTASIPRR